MLAFAAMVVLTLHLAACAFIDIGPRTDVDTFQLALIETRDGARLSNVIVETIVYRTGARLTVASSSQGSGVVVHIDDAYAYILTNYHVTDRGNRDHFDYTVRAADADDKIDAEMVHEDEAYDLAVLRVDRELLHREVIDIFTRLDEPLRRGEFVLAIGSPRMVDGIVTYGRYLRMVGIENVDFQVILHDALIYRGSSGGALVDIDGHLVGINTWGGVETDNNGLAVPLIEVHAFLHDAGIFDSITEQVEE